MKVLVTGATGFLGGALTTALIRERQEVRILARKTSILDKLTNLPIDIRFGCLEDKASLGSVLEGIEYVYHCAALSSDWGSWDDFYKSNVQGVKNLLEAAQEAGSVQRFIHISTSDVYGYPIHVVDESHPIKEIGLPYNRTKVLGEKAVWDFYKKMGLPITVIRPVTLYGPRSLSIVVEFAAVLLKKQMVLIDGGHIPAGLLYIDNAVEGILQAALSPKTIGQAYNLRDESNETWHQFISALAKGIDVGFPRMTIPSNLALGIAYISEIIYRMMNIKKRPLFSRHVIYFLCRDQGFPIKKAQQDFGYRSKVGFAEGMERTLTWLASEEGKRALSHKLNNPK